MNLRRRLLIGYGTLVLVMVVAFALVLLSMARLGRSPEIIVADHYPSVIAAERMKQTVQIQQNAIMRKLLNDDYALGGVLEHTREAFERWVASARASITLDGEAALVDSISRDFARLQALLDDESHWSGGLYPWEPTLVDAFNAVSKSADRLVSLNFAAMESRSASARGQLRETVMETAIVAVAALALALWLTYRTAGSLGRPIEELADGAEAVAAGDYDVTLERAGVAEVDRLTARFNDMTAALRRYEALNLERRVNEQRQADAVLRSIDDGLVIFDQSGKLVRINPVATRQLALDADAVLGLEAGEALSEHAGLPAAVARTLGRDHDETLVPRGREVAVGKPPRRRWLRYRALPTLDRAGRRNGVVLVLRDVTDDRAFEQMRSQFVLRASHELRTPVTAAHMASAMLVERAPFEAESREQDLLATTHEEMGRMLRLVDDLFDLSRMQSERRPLKRELCSPARLLEAACARFALRAEQARIRLHGVAGANTRDALLDVALVERVLDNLLGNALRHTPAGGEVKAMVERVQTSLTFTVSDTGSGIEYAELARIFEPFVQAGDRAGGAGLGLAICREIAELHGGTIRAESSEGDGATFIMELPL